MTLLASCNFSPPPAKTVTEPRYILKFVPYAQNQAVHGYFSLADAATNQVAAAGRLRLHLYMTTSMTVGGGTPAPGQGMTLRSTLYDNTFPLGATNFHWENYGSIFQVRDLVCRFVIPYSAFRIPPTRGSVPVLQMEFHPASGSNALTSVRKVILY